MSQEEDPREKAEIEVHMKPGANKRTRTVAAELQALLEGPLFEKLVREAVEEMFIEGKLTYDIDSEEINDPETIIKRWAVKREKEAWSVKKRRGRARSSKDVTK